MFAPVFHRETAEFASDIFSGFFGEEVPAILMSEIVGDEILFFVLQQEAVADRGKVLVVIGVKASFPYAGKERWIFQNQLRTFTAMNSKICSDQSAGGMAQNSEFIIDDLLNKCDQIGADTDQIVFLFVSGTLSMTIAVHQIQVILLG